MKIRTAFLASAAASIIGSAALAAPVTYTIDSNHTYPSFEADHFGGLSTWRGKLNSTSGKITYDAQAQSGTVDVKVDMASIDFGNDKLNDHAKSPEIFDVAKYPTATYTGKLAGFKGGKPTEVDGTLELHGVTKPVKLKIDSFLCKQNPMNKKDTCGANASATINREDFGVTYGKSFGFHQEVKLEIQVEAVKGE
ncbi:polyisoprenoid-binding protein YceI [Povalibacter uvarum]|uniref:Polyisoprenoid-binding protein YceI n=1 Tax=Povalibacter uvarum TaxID=732238 RepID=A0A841HF64_9GAMM|nr:YceI family protein [Povalibacter uvarum]MBB6091751.1 polyisoprenoid-binding protein YceI [Povalibacter uvarum]